MHQGENVNQFNGRDNIAVKQCEKQLNERRFHTFSFRKMLYVFYQTDIHI